MTSPVPSSLTRPTRIFMAAALALLTMRVPLAAQESVLASTQAPAQAPAQTARPAEPSPFSGHWEGEMDMPEGLGKMGIKVDLRPATSPQAWSGTIDIPMQSAEAVPLVGIQVDGASVRFTLVGSDGNPTFAGRLANGKISGTFTQGDKISVPFWLGRDRVVDPPKMQDPKPPFPYKAEEVNVTSGAVTLAGTLTTPDGPGPFPAVVLIGGSGAQDRDESIADHRPFWVLADHLSRRGVAVLRTDDRGVGGSTGDLSAATSADLAQDALAAVALLKARPGIDPKRIGLLGHSEGATVATLAATKSSDAAFLILLAGPGVRGEEILLRQLELITRANGEGEETVAKKLERQKRILAALRTMQPAEAEAEIRKVISLSLQDTRPEDIREMGGAILVTESAVKEYTSPWFRTFVALDPRVALRKVKKPPVLVLQGEKDLQVQADQNLPEIEKALRESGNPDVTVKRLPGLNHLFQPADTGALSEYERIEVTIAPMVLDLISDWIRTRFQGAGRPQGVAPTGGSVSPNLK